jgi:orotate phosphoribosyltransferase/uridine monophosphate synthetase
MARDSARGNLWLAKELWDLGAVQFGEFNIGRTLNSPIYLNPRLLVSNPQALARVARVIKEETETMLSMRHPTISPFSLVAGVPFGGLHLATAFSLASKVPLIYLHPRKDDGNVIEGNYLPGQTVLVIDDLITGGTSIVETAQELRAGGLIVRDAIVLLDRHQRGKDRLRSNGITLHPMLELETLLNYLMSHGKIPEDSYRRSIDYIAAQRGEADSPAV